MSDLSTNCVIWPGFMATELSVIGHDFTRFLTSERAGGPYAILMAIDHYPEALDDQAKARLTTWLVDQRTQGVDWPLVTRDVIDYARVKRPLSVVERADRLLRYIANQVESVGHMVSVTRNTLPTYAWSESVNWSELEYFVNYLVQKELLKGIMFAGGGFEGTVTVNGYSRIAELEINVDSSQAFVAMWFDDSMSEACEQGIEPRIRDAGYEPLLINSKEHINRIDDEIIAEIRRSRFVVADFTHGKDGARGSVYYEAGFAHGLGLPVIFTCKKDSLENLHFDTEHYNHIVWTNESELRVKLRNRILAAIGQGPSLNTIP